MNVGIIGAGHIAHALAESWARPGINDAPGLVLCDVVPEKAEELAAAVGGSVAATIGELVASSDLVVVAVRPQHVAGVLRELGPSLGERNLISVAAGVPTDRLLADLPAGAHAGRVMPTVSLAIGVGVAVAVPGTLTADGWAQVQRLFSLGGALVTMEERLFDVATAVSGCMPGMLATIIESFADAAVAQGVDAETARVLAREGVHGAAAVIAQNGDPAAVRTAVATPGGVTAAAVEALEGAGIHDVLREAIDAGTARAKALT